MIFGLFRSRSKQNCEAILCKTESADENISIKTSLPSPISVKRSKIPNIKKLSSLSIFQGAETPVLSLNVNNPNKCQHDEDMSEFTTGIGPIQEVPVPVYEPTGTIEDVLKKPKSLNKVKCDRQFVFRSYAEERELHFLMQSLIDDVTSVVEEAIIERTIRAAVKRLAPEFIEFFARQVAVKSQKLQSRLSMTVVATHSSGMLLQKRGSMRRCSSTVDEPQEKLLELQKQQQDQEGQQEQMQKREAFLAQQTQQHQEKEEQPHTALTQSPPPSPLPVPASPVTKASAVGGTAAGTASTPPSTESSPSQRVRAEVQRLQQRLTTPVTPASPTATLTRSGGGGGAVTSPTSTSTTTGSGDRSKANPLLAARNRRSLVLS